MKNVVIKVLFLALDLAEEYAKDTLNPIDDIAVSAAAKILRQLFSVEAE